MKLSTPSPKAPGKPIIPSKLKKIKRTTLSENITQQLLGLVSSGDLKAGQRLPAERDLCKHFGVSRSSLREAIRSLAILGILKVSIGNGTFLATNAERFVSKVFEWRLLTEKHNMENLMEVRLALECAAAARAAVCGTEEQFRQLDALVSRMHRTIKDPKAFIELDLEFHVTIAEASRNNLLVELLYMIRNQLSLAIFTFASMPGGAALAYRHHADLLKALKSRNPKAARTIMQNHLAVSLNRFLKAQEQAPGETVSLLPV